MGEGPDVARPRGRGRARAIRIILVVAGALLALVLLGTVAVILSLRYVGWSPGGSVARVSGSAMAPTVADGDYLVVQPYSGSTPRPGDIIEFRSPYHRRNNIMRVVAGPGQTVLIRGGQVIVDGRPLSEPYVAGKPWTVSADWPKSGSAATLGSDEFFVLGDNRNDSTDSRVFGPVRRDDIRGRVVFIQRRL
jgi:signal peptidase I